MPLWPAPAQSLGASPACRPLRRGCGGRRCAAPPVSRAPHQSCTGTPTPRELAALPPAAAPTAPPQQSTQGRERRAACLQRQQGAPRRGGPEGRAVPEAGPLEGESVQAVVRGRVKLELFVARQAVHARAPHLHDSTTAPQSPRRAHHPCHRPAGSSKQAGQNLRARLRQGTRALRSGLTLGRSAGAAPEGPAPPSMSISSAAAPLLLAPPLLGAACTTEDRQTISRQRALQGHGHAWRKQHAGATGHIARAPLPKKHQQQRPSRRARQAPCKWPAAKGTYPFLLACLLRVARHCCTRKQSPSRDSTTTYKMKLLFTGRTATSKRQSPTSGCGHHHCKLEKQLSVSVPETPSSF